MCRAAPSISDTSAFPSLAGRPSPARDLGGVSSGASSSAKVSEGIKSANKVPLPPPVPFGGRPYAAGPHQEAEEPDGLRHLSGVPQRRPGLPQGRSVRGRLSPAPRRPWTGALRRRSGEPLSDPVQGTGAALRPLPIHRPVQRGLSSPSSSTTASSIWSQDPDNAPIVVPVSVLEQSYGRVAAHLPWQCSRCTTVNLSDADFCEACDTPRHAARPAVPSRPDPVPLVYRRQSAHSRTLFGVDDASKTGSGANVWTKRRR